MPERRQSHPKVPTGLDDETAVETHDLIHRAEEEEQKMHGKDALTQEDDGPQEGNQQGQSAMDKVKGALNLGK
ncbi:Ff.00g101310.m01.CDS01 [Fusarium sp. VM40]|nr:Ff.00g101310.m01.CDS01 [Fusarium sp. VM40]